MFIHNFKYSFLTLFRNKGLIFWTFAFPIILGTFFNLAFSDIENSEKLDIIDIAIVDNNEFRENIIFNETFKILSDEDNEERLFNTEYLTLEECKDKLENKEISGYLLIENKPKVVVNTSGVNETILKQVAEEIIQTSKISNNITNIEINKEVMKGNYNIDYKKIYNNTLNIINNVKVELKDISSDKLSYTMIEFYTLIAMTCMYGGIIGMSSINNTLANASSVGKRVAVSKLSKLKLIFSSLLASYLVQVIGIILLFIYTIFILKVDYGTRLLPVIILSLLGTLSGLSFGIFIGTIVKSNNNTKTGIIISITMLWCFLSGMMGITMKYIIDKNIPIINKLNPVAMITDGFYSLYYYDTLDRFNFNIISLIIFSSILLLISISTLRRRKYDSI